jgi:hypothetical protein
VDDNPENLKSMTTQNLTWIVSLFFADVWAGRLWFSIWRGRIGAAAIPASDAIPHRADFPIGEQ